MFLFAETLGFLMPRIMKLRPACPKFLLQKNFDWLRAASGKRLNTKRVVFNTWFQNPASKMIDTPDTFWRNSQKLSAEHELIEKVISNANSTLELQPWWPVPPPIPGAESTCGNFLQRAQSRISQGNRFLGRISRTKICDIRKPGQNLAGDATTCGSSAGLG